MRWWSCSPTFASPEDLLQEDDEELVIQPRYSKRLVASSHLALLCAGGGLLLLCDVQTFVVNMLVYLTSVLYWMRPVRGFRRYIDICTSSAAIGYHLHLSYRASLFVPYASAVVGCCVIYAMARWARDNNLSSLLHCSLHVVGTAINLGLYSTCAFIDASPSSRKWHV